MRLDDGDQRNVEFDRAGESPAAEAGLLGRAECRGAMRSFVAALLIAWGACVIPAQHAVTAQDHAPFFGGLNAGLAFVDNHRTFLLNRTGFQVAGYVGRQLSPHLGGLAELALTSVSHEELAMPLRGCISPGCSSPLPPLTNVAGIALSPGVQFNRTTRDHKMALTVAPGVMWFLSRPEGAHALSPMVTASVSLLFGAEGRIGVRAGGQWWLTEGALPRWAVPAGVILEFP